MEEQTNKPKPRGRKAGGRNKSPSGELSYMSISDIIATIGPYADGIPNAMIKQVTTQSGGTRNEPSGRLYLPREWVGGHVLCINIPPDVEIKLMKQNLKNHLAQIERDEMKKIEENNANKQANGKKPIQIII